MMKVSVTSSHPARQSVVAPPHQRLEGTPWDEPRFSACPKNRKTIKGLKIAGLLSIPVAMVGGLISGLGGVSTADRARHNVDARPIYQAQTLVKPIEDYRKMIRHEDLDNPTLVTESAQGFFGNMARTVIAHSEDDAALKQVDFLTTLNEPEQRLTRDLYLRLKGGNESSTALLTEWMDKVLVYHVPNDVVDQAKAEIKRYEAQYQTRLATADAQYNAEVQRLNQVAKQSLFLMLISVLAGAPLTAGAVMKVESLRKQDDEKEKSETSQPEGK